MPLVALSLLLLLGATLLFFLATTALLRLPDPYTRLKIMGKALGLGMAALTLGLALYRPDWITGAKLLAAWLYIHLASRLTLRWLERTAAEHRVPPWRL